MRTGYIYGVTTHFTKHSPCINPRRGKPIEKEYRMKKMVSVLVLMFCAATAFAGVKSDVREGVLIDKAYGEVDPYVIGDACLTWILVDGDRTIGVVEFRDDFENCIGANVENNEEIDFDAARLSKIRTPRHLKTLREVQQHFGIRGQVTYFEYGHGIRD